MTATADEAPNTTDLEQAVALIACGTRPGKTQACDRHRHKGCALLAIASEGAADALAAAICGHKEQCQPCNVKAIEIIRVYNERAK